MLPGGIDPKKMDAMMRQMGIRQEPLEAKRVIIETMDNKLVIDEPQVVKITMQGTTSFQIAGKIRTESPDDDVKIVMEQAGCSQEKAKDALQKSNGDIAAAIVLLSEEKE